MSAMRTSVAGILPHVISSFDYSLLKEELCYCSLFFIIFEDIIRRTFFISHILQVSSERRVANYFENAKVFFAKNHKKLLAIIFPCFIGVF